MDRRKDIIPYSGELPFIFISYSHEDMEEAMSVIEKLEEDNYRVWYDAGINPGTEWDEIVASHVENCGYFIALLSEAYLKSSNCKDELNYARTLDKPRLLVYLKAVQLPGGMRMRLSRLQAVYREKYDSEDGFIRRLKETEGLDICKEIFHQSAGGDDEIFAAEADNDDRFYSNGYDSRDELPEKGYASQVYKVYERRLEKYLTLRQYRTEDIIYIPMLSNDALALTLMKLRRTSICPVFDIVKEKNPLVISGFVDGMTLENYIEKKEIVLIHALVIVRCILEALSLLHSMNLYYGDVTPRSIVIDEFGGALLYDFSKSNFNGSVFNESAIRTCKFRSPEKASGAAIDYKSDIYEVGMILDELTVKDVSHRRAEEAFHSGKTIIISEKEGDFPVNNSIRRIIQKAAKRNPNERYSTADEMHDALETLIEQLGFKLGE